MPDTKKGAAPVASALGRLRREEKKLRTANRMIADLFFAWFWHCSRHCSGFRARKEKVLTAVSDCWYFSYAVEPAGIEPATSGLQSQRSPN